jgi:BlaI family penicillinase repressor
MKAMPRISESEWSVMHALWEAGEATANEVVERLSDSTTWKPKTVKTLINRLVQKKAVGFEKKGREYLYRPLVNEEECKRAESRSFLERVYGGATKPMLAAFLETERLSADEISELKRILDDKERK